MAKTSGKAAKRKKTAVKDLTVKDAKSVRGGRAGGDKVKYMEYKMSDVLISGV